MNCTVSLRHIYCRVVNPVVFRGGIAAAEANLKDLSHTYIPKVYDFIVEQDTVYTVMDFIDGESLDKPLKRGEHFSQPQIITWACQLLEALMPAAKLSVELFIQLALGYSQDYRRYNPTCGRNRNQRYTGVKKQFSAHPFRHRKGSESAPCSHREIGARRISIEGFGVQRWNLYQWNAAGAYCGFGGVYGADSPAAPRII